MSQDNIRSSFFARHPKVQAAIVTVSPFGLAGVAMAGMALYGFFEKQGDWSNILLSDGLLAPHAWETALVIAAAVSLVYIGIELCMHITTDKEENESKHHNDSRSEANGDNSKSSFFEREYSHSQ